MAKLNDLSSEDLVIEILSRLPVNSLMRFKCASKSWCSLVRNPHFMAKHRKNHVRSASDDLCILVQRRRPKTDVNILSILTFDDRNNMQETRVDDDLLDKTANFEIWGVCNGIICFGKDKLTIANPATRETKILPESRVCLRPNDDDYRARQLRAIGFGYDPKADDYKVVRVWAHVPKNNNIHPFPRRAEVYTLSTDSWREIDNFRIEVEIDNVAMMVYIFYVKFLERYWNGAYYWFGAAYGLENTWNVIVLFDMTYEVFRCIVMPQSCQGKVCLSLTELNGSLALVHHLWGENSFDIWTMDEFGVNGTWTKPVRIGPLRDMSMPFLFVKSDELLMEDNEQMVSYNLTTKQIKKLPIYGDKIHFQTWIYEQRLVNFSSQGKLSISSYNSI
ncbi:hypothetical protein SLA2020_129030 [Shorea laevis]